MKDRDGKTSIFGKSVTWCVLMTFAAQSLLLADPSVHDLAPSTYFNIAPQTHVSSPVASVSPALLRSEPITSPHSTVISGALNLFQTNVAITRLTREWAREAGFLSVNDKAAMVFTYVQSRKGIESLREEEVKEYFAKIKSVVGKTSVVPDGVRYAKLILKSLSDPFEMYTALDFVFSNVLKAFDSDLGVDQKEKINIAMVMFNTLADVLNESRIDVTTGPSEVNEVMQSMLKKMNLPERAFTETDIIGDENLKIKPRAAEERLMTKIMGPFNKKTGSRNVNEGAGYILPQVYVLENKFSSLSSPIVRDVLGLGSVSDRDEVIDLMRQTPLLPGENASQYFFNTFKPKENNTTQINRVYMVRMLQLASISPSELTSDELRVYEFAVNTLNRVMSESGVWQAKTPYMPYFNPKVESRYSRALNRKYLDRLSSSVHILNLLKNSAKGHVLSSVDKVLAQPGFWRVEAVDSKFSESASTDVLNEGKSEGVVTPSLDQFNLMQKSLDAFEKTLDMFSIKSGYYSYITDPAKRDKAAKALSIAYHTAMLDKISNPNARPEEVYLKLLADDQFNDVPSVFVIKLMIDRVKSKNSDLSRQDVVFREVVQETIAAFNAIAIHNGWVTGETQLLPEDFNNESATDEENYRSRLEGLSLILTKFNEVLEESGTRGLQLLLNESYRRNNELNAELTAPVVMNDLLLEAEAFSENRLAFSEDVRQSDQTETIPPDVGVSGTEFDEEGDELPFELVNPLNPEKALQYRQWVEGLQRMKQEFRGQEYFSQSLRIKGLHVPGVEKSKEVISEVISNRQHDETSKMLRKLLPFHYENLSAEMVNDLTSGVALLQWVQDTNKSALEEELNPSQKLAMIINMAYQNLEMGIAELRSDSAYRAAMGFFNVVDLIQGFPGYMDSESGRAPLVIPEELYVSDSLDARYAAIQKVNVPVTGMQSFFNTDNFEIRITEALSKIANQMKEHALAVESINALGGDFKVISDPDLRSKADTAFGEFQALQKNETVSVSRGNSLMRWVSDVDQAGLSPEQKLSYILYQGLLGDSSFAGRLSNDKRERVNGAVDFIRALQYAMQMDSTSAVTTVIRQLKFQSSQRPVSQLFRDMSELVLPALNRQKSLDVLKQKITPQVNELPDRDVLLARWFAPFEHFAKKTRKDLSEASASGDINIRSVSNRLTGNLNYLDYLQIGTLNHLPNTALQPYVFHILFESAMDQNNWFHESARGILQTLHYQWPKVYPSSKMQVSYDSFNLEHLDIFLNEVSANLGLIEPLIQQVFAKVESNVQPEDIAEVPEEIRQNIGEFSLVPVYQKNLTTFLNHGEAPQRVQVLASIDAYESQFQTEQDANRGWLMDALKAINPEMIHSSGLLEGVSLLTGWLFKYEEGLDFRQKLYGLLEMGTIRNPGSLSVLERVRFNQAVWAVNILGQVVLNPFEFFKGEKNLRNQFVSIDKMNTNSVSDYFHRIYHFNEVMTRINGLEQMSPYYRLDREILDKIGLLKDSLRHESMMAELARQHNTDKNVRHTEARNIWGQFRESLYLKPVKEISDLTEEDIIRNRDTQRFHNNYVHFDTAKQFLFEMNKPENQSRQMTLLQGMFTQILESETNTEPLWAVLVSLVHSWKDLHPDSGFKDMNVSFESLNHSLARTREIIYKLISEMSANAGLVPEAMIHGVDMAERMQWQYRDKLYIQKWMHDKKIQYRNWAKNPLIQEGVSPKLLAWRQYAQRIENKLLRVLVRPFIENLIRRQLRNDTLFKSPKDYLKQATNEYRRETAQYDLQIREQYSAGPISTISGITTARHMVRLLNDSPDFENGRQLFYHWFGSLTTVTAETQYAMSLLLDDLMTRDDQQRWFTANEMDPDQIRSKFYAIYSRLEALPETRAREQLNTLDRKLMTMLQKESITLDLAWLSKNYAKDPDLMMYFLSQDVSFRRNLMRLGNLAKELGSQAKNQDELNPIIQIMNKAARVVGLADDGEEYLLSTGVGTEIFIRHFYPAMDALIKNIDEFDPVELREKMNPVRIEYDITEDINKEAQRIEPEQVIKNYMKQFESVKVEQSEIDRLNKMNWLLLKNNRSASIEFDLARQELASDTYLNLVTALRNAGPSNAGVLSFLMNSQFKFSDKMTFLMSLVEASFTQVYMDDYKGAVINTLNAIAFHPRLGLAEYSEEAKGYFQVDQFGRVRIGNPDVYFKLTTENEALVNEVLAEISGFKMFHQSSVTVPDTNEWVSTLTPQTQALTAVADIYESQVNLQRNIHASQFSNFFNDDPVISGMNRIFEHLLGRVGEHNLSTIQEYQVEINEWVENSLKPSIQQELALKNTISQKEAEIVVYSAFAPENYQQYTYSSPILENGLLNLHVSLRAFVHDYFAGKTSVNGIVFRKDISAYMDQLAKTQNQVAKGAFSSVLLPSGIEYPQLTQQLETMANFLIALESTRHEYLSSLNLGFADRLKADELFRKTELQDLHPILMTMLDQISQTVANMTSVQTGLSYTLLEKTQLRISSVLEDMKKTLKWNEYMNGSAPSEELLSLNLDITNPAYLKYIELFNALVSKGQEVLPRVAASSVVPLSANSRTILQFKNDLSGWFRSLSPDPQLRNKFAQSVQSIPNSFSNTALVKYMTDKAREYQRFRIAVKGVAQSELEPLLEAVYMLSMMQDVPFTIARLAPLGGAIDGQMFDPIENMLKQQFNKKLKDALTKIDLRTNLENIKDALGLFLVTDESFDDRLALIQQDLKNDNVSIFRSLPEGLIAKIISDQLAQKTRVGEVSNLHAERIRVNLESVFAELINKKKIQTKQKRVAPPPLIRKVEVLDEVVEPQQEVGPEVVAEIIEQIDAEELIENSEVLERQVSSAKIIQVDFRKKSKIGTAVATAVAAAAALILWFKPSPVENVETPKDSVTTIGEDNVQAGNSAPVVTVSLEDLPIEEDVVVLEEQDEQIGLDEESVRQFARLHTSKELNELKSQLSKNKSKQRDLLLVNEAIAFKSRQKRQTPKKLDIAATSDELDKMAAQVSKDLEKFGQPETVTSPVEPSSPKSVLGREDSPFRDFSNYRMRNSA